MLKTKSFLASLCLLFVVNLSHAQEDKTQLAVWANEAIIATYTYNYKNYTLAQRNIAKYFTTAAWIAYTKALNASKLPESIQKNAYFVSAVATAPPEIKSLDNTHWQANMPILVVYKNAQFQQQQHLQVMLQFSKADSGTGVRGFNIVSLQTKVSEPPCICTTAPGA